MNKKSIKLKSNDAGFTIIELLIATLIFSVVLLIATYSIIQVSRIYIKGYISSDTQNVNRTIVQQITSEIQQSGSATISIDGNSNLSNPASEKPIVNVYWFCINNDRYTYTEGTGAELVTGNNNPESFLLDQTTDCSQPANLGSPPASAKELLTPHMRVLAPISNNGNILSVMTDPNGAKLFQIDLTLLYGDGPPADIPNYGSQSNLGSPNFSCNSLESGGAFCAKSTISTSVQQRSSL